MPDIENRLGEKVDLPYPGEGEFGEEISSPFKGNNAKKSSFSQPEKSHAQAPKEAQAPTQQPHQQAAVPTKADKIGATTKQLDAFRRAFGLKRIPIHRHVVHRVVEGEKTSLTFSLRPMNHEDYQWAVEKAASLRLSNITASLAWQVATVAISVASIDDHELDAEETATPIWKVFGLEPEKSQHVNDPFYPHHTLRFAAADLMWNETRETLFDFVNELAAVVELMEENDKKEQKAGEENPLPPTTSSNTIIDSGSVVE